MQPLLPIQSMNARARQLGLLAAAAVACLASARAIAEDNAPATGTIIQPAGCTGRTDTLGVSRVVEIDTTGGPRLGTQYADEVAFLEDGEVVLTFDDGPIARYTRPILDALDAHCTKATFFTVGRMAIADPETLKETHRRGHTIATHSWSHKKQRTIPAAAAREEFELGLSATAAALGGPVAAFFRFPYLADTRAMLAHLEARNLGIIGIHVDSRDFSTRNPGSVVRTVMSQLKVAKKGLVLFHDIQPATAGALATLLGELKVKGYKVVHLVAKTPAVTLPEYDARAQKLLASKQLAAHASPLASRSAVWPIGSPKRDHARPEKGDGDEVLPWLTTTEPEAPTASPQAVKPEGERRSTERPRAASPESDSWAVNPLGKY